jgi:NAD(P)H-hydrate epimerase
MTHSPTFSADERAITREQARRTDQLATEQLGIPSLLLMENAAINTASGIVDLLDVERNLRPDQATVAVVCGGGNNGGDGYAIARHLHNWGAAVEIHAAKAPDELKGDAGVNATICRKMGLALHHPPRPERFSAAHVLVDALLGTGFEGAVREKEAQLIEAINAAAGPLVVAVDTPSGLDCQTGQPANATVKAHVTVTFVERKVGFNNPASRAFVGQLKVAEIGTPPELLDRILAEAS